MLPFMKKNKESSVSVASEAIKREPDHEVEYDALHAAAEDILQAIEKKDVANLAIALRAAFELCDSEPHVEGPHLEE